MHKDNAIQNKLKKLWKAGGFHVVFGNFLNKFVVFFGSLLIVRFLSKTEYGELSYIENLYNFVYIIAGFGLSNAVLRFIVLEKDLDKKQTIFYYLVKMAMTFNCGIVVMGCIINCYYPHAEKFEAVSGYIYIMLLMLPAQYFNDNNLTLKRAMFDNTNFAYFNCAYAILVIMGKCIGAYSAAILGVVIIGIVIQYMYAIWIFICNKKKYFSRNKEKTVISTKKKREILVYSFQYMITNGMWSLFMLVDIFLLGLLMEEPTAIADYKVAYAWPANISIVCSAVGMFVAPYFIKGEEDSKWVRKNFKKTFILNFFAVSGISIIISIAAKPLIFIYGGVDYYNVIPLMRTILISSFINNGLRYMTANCLAAMGKIRANMIVSFIGLILQIALDLLLIPRFGFFGPAYSGIIVYVFMALVLFGIFNHKYGIIQRRS